MKTNCHTALLVAGVLASFSLLGACNGDDHEHTHESTYPSCQAIIDACHHVDVGQGGTVSDCHANAHDAKSEEACAPTKDSCVAACKAAEADGGGGHGGHGGHDAGGDAHDQ